MNTASRGRRSVVAVACLAVLLGACSSSNTTRSKKTSKGSTTVGIPTLPRPTAPHAPGTVSLAAQAYVWGSPLVITERTLQTFARLFGVNHVFSQGALSTPASRTVVAPNVDTLYSIAVVDLRDGPVVLHVPQIASHYWTYQFVDAWTDSFAYIGTRATAGRGGTWLIAPSSFHGATPAGMARITAPTPQLFMLGRWLPDGDADVPRLAAAIRTVTMRPLAATQATPVIGRPAGTPQTVAKQGARFFDELGDALAINAPATKRDTRLLARFSSLGIGPGHHPGSSGTSTQQHALAAGVTAGVGEVQAAARLNNGATKGWLTHLDIGTYTNALVRAVTAQYGWGANIPAEAVYARSTIDATNRAYDGNDLYDMHFAAGQSPPTKAFWSLTLYGPDQFLVANSLHRYAISTRTTGFKTNADGSFDIWIGHTPPASGTSNWLPAPPGPFLLSMRMYLPGPSVLSGDYTLPGAMRVTR
ncbi:MAG TPA: DUF1254 domain-containing protein [Acidimicrobiia bacterium]|jgi:hypothetical protein